jgi:hypothetical protein
MGARIPDVNQENRHAERPAAQQSRKEKTEAAAKAGDPGRPGHDATLEEIAA